MNKRQYKRWSDQEKAWLLCNMGAGNIELSKEMGRSIPSIESMKRDLRKGKRTTQPEMIEVLEIMPQPHAYWMRDYEMLIDRYISQLRVTDEPEIKPRATAQVVSTNHVKSVAQELIEEGYDVVVIGREEEESEPIFIEGIDYPIVAVRPAVIHEPIEDDGILDTLPTCASDKQESLGVTIRDFTTVSAVIGFIVVVIFILLILLAISL